MLLSNSILAQQHLSLNWGGAVAYNFNTPLQTLEQPYEAHSNYLSPNILAHISYDVNRSYLSLESTYHFRNYGFVIEFSEKDYYLRLFQKQITETINGVIRQQLKVSHRYNRTQNKHYLVFKKDREVHSAYPILVR